MCSITPDAIYYRLTFSLCILYFLILLQVVIICLYSISPDPLSSSHSLSVFYISCSSYKFSFSVYVPYLLILLQVHILCMCSISPDPIYYRFSFSVCILYLLILYITGCRSLSVFYIS